MSTLQEHESFPKLARFRQMLITEKIDGTNAQVIVDEHGVVRAGSRTRLITPEADNFGFAAWVKQHEEELRSHLGIGRHFGEWYGAGIQRRYGLDHKRFAVFDTRRGFGEASYWAGRREAGQSTALEGVLTCVPLLYHGPFTSDAIGLAMDNLRSLGSSAVPGFMNPEGVVVRCMTTGSVWKKTLDGDGHKGGLTTP